MTNKIKIKISEPAYNKLLSILKQEDEKLYIRFAYKDGCCGSSKIDIIVDKFNEGDTVETIDSLPIIYNSLVIDNIKEVTLVYRNNSFMTKTVLSKARDCGTCKVGCKTDTASNSNGGCSGSCSKCK